MASVVSKLWVIQRCPVRTIVVFALIRPRYMMWDCGTMVGYCMVGYSMMPSRCTQFVILHWYLSSVTQRYRSIRMGWGWVVEVGNCSIMRAWMGSMGWVGMMSCMGMMGYWGHMMGYRGSMMNWGVVWYWGWMVMNWGVVSDWGWVVMDWGVMGCWGHPVLIDMWDGVWMWDRGMVRGGFGVVRYVRVVNGIDFFFDNLQCWWVDFMDWVVSRMEVK